MDLISLVVAVVDLRMILSVTQDLVVVPSECHLELMVVVVKVL
jgi:hypothetical protein